ncbi:MAG: hypothetical protein ACOX0Y_05765 [Thiopseudomonas sp.]
MQRKIIMSLLASGVALGGCVPYSQAPQPTNFLTDEQQHVRAASHWQLIAGDSARQLMLAMPEKRPVHVVRKNSESPFEQAFATQLATELTRAGYPVMKSAERHGTLLVEVSAQAVQFSEKRQRPAAAGELTLLAGGLWVLRNVYENVSPGAAMIGGTLAVDGSRWFGSQYGKGLTVPKTELIVTASISSREQYLAQTSAAYYTTQTDWGLYATNSALPLKGGL